MFIRILWYMGWCRWQINIRGVPRGGLSKPLLLRWSELSIDSRLTRSRSSTNSIRTCRGRGLNPNAVTALRSVSALHNAVAFTHASLLFSLLVLGERPLLNPFVLQLRISVLVAELRRWRVHGVVGQISGELVG